MNYKGIIAAWKDEKGFGFIQPVENGPQIFFHIKEVQGAARRPLVGDTVYYRLGVSQDGRTCAQAVHIQGQDAVERETSHNVSGNPIPFALMVFCFAASVHFMLRTHYPVPLLYLIFSWVTYQAYGDDKNRARQNSYRIPETSLHFLEMIGGWPGGYFAQQMLRHKTVKLSYQLAFWGIVLSHLGIWAAWLYFGEFKKV